MNKELDIGLDVQQLDCLGCKWTASGHMFLNQGTNFLIKSIETAINEIYLETVKNK